MLKTPLIGAIAGVLALVSASAEAADAMALASKYSCLACHAVDKQVIGPAWKDVAAKYRKDPHARETLMDSVMYGTGGKWGNRNMRGQKQVPKEDVAKLVDYILALPVK